MKLLIIEDEKALAKEILTYLKSQSFICEWVSDKKNALDRLISYDYDCVLLDLALPDGHGFELLVELKELKKSEGIIIISAKGTLESKIEGMELGADDYLIKPFHLSELLVRIQALLRRKNFNGNNKLVYENIHIHLLSKTVVVEGNTLDLTKTEYELLMYLISNENRVLSKNAIAEHLSGDMADMLDNHDFIYAHIKNLKRKLSSVGAVDCIKSMYGSGYKWNYG